MGGLEFGFNSAEAGYFRFDSKSSLKFNEWNVANSINTFLFPFKKLNSISRAAS